VVIPPAPPVKYEEKEGGKKAPACPNWIMFHSFRSGDLEVFRIDGIEGKSQPVNLTKNASTDSRPSRSPDGKLVVFQSTRNGNVELYLTDSEGKTQTRLTDSKSNNINAMFGPDNRTIVYQSDRNGNWDVYMLDINSKKEKQLTADTGDNVNAFWSPDSNWITYQSNRTGSWNVYIFDISKATEYQVTSFSTDVLNPSWSPNGKQLSFFLNVSGTWDLYVSDLQGNSFKQISIGGDAGNASWAPQGDRIAYQITNGSNTDVYTYDLVTNIEYKLTEFSGVDSAPSWNCGGTEVTFTSVSEGDPNIFSVWWQGGSPITEITNHPSTDKWSASSEKETGSRGY
jgi:TolB protein